MSGEKKKVLRIDKVYTRGGDKGETSLGNGDRVLKDDPRVEAFGTIDELNCVVGLVRCANLKKPESGSRDKFDLILKSIQQRLFDVGSELAINATKETNILSLNEENIKWLEAVIDTMNEDLKVLDSFVLPGGGELNSFLHQARSVCRRSERRVITLSRDEKIGSWIVPYINRLSDAFFVFSRWTTLKMGEPEFLWEPGQTDPDISN